MRITPKLPALVWILLALLHTACDSSERPSQQKVAEQARETIEAVSLLGEPLAPPVLDEEFAQSQRTLLTLALTTLGERPRDPDAIIWAGRRMAYLGQYQRAIWTYSRGIDSHPDEARLYRHRGHRYLTIRRLDAAIRDLSRAAELIEGTEDQVEPDGLPNARNIPTSTLHTNVWYHLGLAHYLQGDFEAALEAYRRCLEASKNPDMSVATSHWLYMTLRRLGQDGEAARVLEPIHADMDIIENGAYHDLLLMYRGERDPDELLASAREAGEAALATSGYGVGNWFFYGGDGERALEIFREIVATGAWPSFGYIAAEAELARLAEDEQAAES